MSRRPVLWALGLALLLAGVALGRILAPRPLPPEISEPLTTTNAGGIRRATEVDGQEKRRPATGFLGVLALTTMLVAPAFAHEGEDHGTQDKDAAPRLSVPLDGPRRLPDGSLFVSKPTQRLLSVRTAVARVEEVPQTSEIIGQVIGDPNTSGRVQSSQEGRIEPPEEGLPVLGQSVTQGQILAFVSPTITTVERGSLRQQVAELDTSIAIAEQRVTRLSQLEGSIPQREIDEARRELDGLRRRRSALAPALGDREVLRASTSGVISTANVVAGQIVEPREVLFEIIDPSRLWIEAIAFDPTVVTDINHATAKISSEESVPLEYVGRGLALRQLAIPLQFRITHPSPWLSVGTAVTVTLQTSERRSGIPLPAKSVVRGANGLDLVFEHASAERFVPRPVRFQPLDGARVVIVDGIGPDLRIVTQGAGLLNQIR